MINNTICAFGIEGILEENWSYFSLMLYCRNAFFGMHPHLDEQLSSLSGKKFENKSFLHKMKDSGGKELYRLDVQGGVGTPIGDYNERGLRDVYNMTAPNLAIMYVESEETKKMLERIKSELVGPDKKFKTWSDEFKFSLKPQEKEVREVLRQFHRIYQD